MGGLTRRLFDTDFQHAVVQAREQETGAEQVHEVTLTNGDTRQLTPDSSSPYSAHPRHDLAVFGPDGRTVWYRSANDGTVHVIDPNTRVDETMMSIDPQAVAFTVLKDQPEQVFAQRDRTSASYALDLRAAESERRRRRERRQAVRARQRAFGPVDLRHGRGGSCERVPPR